MKNSHRFFWCANSSDLLALGAAHVPSPSFGQFFGPSLELSLRGSHSEKGWCQKDSTSWERELRNHLISNFVERCRILTDWFLKQSVHLSDDCLVHWEVRRIPGSAHVITWKWCFFWLSPSVRMVFCPFGNGAMGSRGLFIARISARILMETGHGCWLPSSRA